MGSELSRRGLDTSSPMWSALALETSPDSVVEVHADYVRAGATHHRTNTFRARPRTAGAEWERLARRAVALARRAVIAPNRVLGSLGPLEDCYRPDLAPSDADALREHAQFARLLVQEGVDGLVCETFPSAREAAIATRACALTGKETWTSLTAGPSGELMTPSALAEAARACVDEGASVVLVNCVAAELCAPYVEALLRVHPRVGVYANASRWNEPPIDARAYASYARRWVESGVSVVGACCGASPAFIEALAAP